MKKALWIIVILALIIGGVWLYRSMNDENASTGTLENATSTTSTASGTDTAGNNNGGVTGMKTTLGGIFDDPGSHQCDYEQVSQTSRSTNVIYISGGKLRGEFRTQTATTSTLSMMVYDGTYLYVWTEGMPTGRISQPKTIADLPSAIPQDITSGKILGSSSNNVSWNCHAWSKDATKLVRPSYVKFN